jgi:hypothetical protein
VVLFSAFFVYFSQTRRFLCIAAFDAHSHPQDPSAVAGSSPSLSLIHSAHPTTAARASSSSAMLIDAATVSSTPSSTGEWFCFLRFLFISLKHAAFSALQHSMPTVSRMIHPRSTTRGTHL